MPLLLAVLLLGPAETIAGKVEPPRSPPPPLPAPLPTSSAELCRLVEAGHDGAALFAALGEAFLAEGENALAYRAFHRAHRAEPADPAWGRRMVERKDACGVRVPDATVRAEEREAAVWVAALRDYRRDRAAAGEDPEDLGPFHDRYGRPEENVFRVVRARQFSWAGGVGGILLGAGFVLAARLVPRRAALLPLAVGVACLLGPSIVGRRGLFPIGAAAALAGAATTALWGRRGGARGGV